MEDNKARQGGKGEVEVGEEEDREASCKPSLVAKVKWVLKPDRSPERREKEEVEVQWEGTTRVT